MPKFDIPVVEPNEKAAKRYVTIPDTDLFDMPHQPVIINGIPYGPGTHLLEAELAGTVEERLKAYTQSNVRILQPRRDFSAEQTVDRNRGSANAGSRTVNF